MTRDELIKRLQAMDANEVVVITDGKGWSNIEEVQDPHDGNDGPIKIVMEQYSVFSDN